MKKIMSTIAVVLVMGSLFLAACKSGSKPGKLLAFNFEKGKGYDYEIIWDLDQQMMGKDNKITISALYGMDVTDDRNDIKTIRSVYKNFKMYMSMMGMELDIDTDKPSAPMSEEEVKANPLGMMGRMFTGIKDKEFTMQVDKEGKVIAVNGFDKILSSMIDSIDVQEDMKLQIRASLQDQFNEQNVKDQFAQIFTIFPNKEVKVGDSWQKSWNTGGRMAANYATKYTVKEIEGDHVQLDANTAINSNEEQMKIKGTQKGNLLVDAKTGMVLTATFDQDATITGQGMEVKLVGKGKIKGKER